MGTKGFPIFRQVEGKSIGRHETLTIRLLISTIKFPAIVAPRVLWLSTVRCPVDLATKANPCQ